MMLKALPLVHFWSILLLKEQMMTSVRKTLKRLVWSAQNRSISSEICLKNNHKIGRFLPITFWGSLPRKLPRNYSEIGRFFCEFVPREIWIYQKPCIKDWYINNLSKSQVHVVYTFWVICRNISRTIIELCMETPYLCTNQQKHLEITFSIKALSFHSRASIRAYKHIF